MLTTTMSDGDPAAGPGGGRQPDEPVAVHPVRSHARSGRPGPRGAGGRAARRGPGPWATVDLGS
jgi:hypothetical protein